MAGPRWRPRGSAVGLRPGGGTRGSNFADGEVACHIPWVWGKTTPEEAIAVRERSSTAALRQRIGQIADSPALVRVADLATRAALSAPPKAERCMPRRPRGAGGQALARGDAAARAP